MEIPRPNGRQINQTNRINRLSKRISRTIVHFVRFARIFISLFFLLVSLFHRTKLLNKHPQWTKNRQTTHTHTCTLTHTHTQLEKDDGKNSRDEQQKKKREPHQTSNTTAGWMSADNGFDENPCSVGMHNMDFVVFVDVSAIVVHRLMIDRRMTLPRYVWLLFRRSAAALCVWCFRAIHFDGDGN